jgi:hypothetical protein
VVTLPTTTRRVIIVLATVAAIAPAPVIASVKQKNAVRPQSNKNAPCKGHFYTNFLLSLILFIGIETFAYKYKCDSGYYHKTKQPINSLLQIKVFLMQTLYT